MRRHWRACHRTGVKAIGGILAKPDAVSEENEAGDRLDDLM